MRSFCKLAMVLAVAALGVGASALGQATGNDSTAPVVEAKAADVLAPMAEAEASDVPAPVDNPFTDDDAVIAPQDIDDFGKSCDQGGGGKGCGPLGGRLAAMCGGEPWSAWSTVAPCAEDCYNLTAGGWVQVGYFTEGKNGDGTGLFNDYPNVVQMQQAWVYVEKAIDDDRCRAYDWGFRADYVYGTDGQDTQAFGGRDGQWDFGWDQGNAYGHAIPQLYVQGAYDNLTVTAGHFYTICGYEVVMAPDNFFYSHAFTQYIAEPFTHTGLLAEYALGENVTLWGGWTAGWDTGFSRNGGDTFLGGFRLKLTESLTFTYTTTLGDFGFDTRIGRFNLPGSDQNAYSHSIVLDWQVTEKFNYVLQSDYVDNELYHFGADPFGFDKSWGVNQYFLYSVNDCLGVGARVEYFDQEAYEVLATTVGLNVKPHANVVLRPEVRWEDWDQGNLVGRQDSFIFGLDMIMTF